jgi:hypothetical protein
MVNNFLRKKKIEHHFELHLYILFQIWSFTREGRVDNHITIIIENRIGDTHLIILINQIYIYSYFIIIFLKVLILLFLCTDFKSNFWSLINTNYPLTFSNVLSAKEVNWKYFLLGANVVDDLAFIVKSLIIVVCYHKTCVSLHNLDEPMPVFSFEIIDYLSFI